MSKSLPSIGLGLRWVLVTLAALLVVGCGGGGGGSTPDPGPGPGPEPTEKTLTGVVAKGRVAGASITAYALNSEAGRSDPLATAQTGDDGQYNLRLPASFQGSIAIVATGGAYVDEVSGETVALAAGEELEAFQNIGQAASFQANVTPLTSLAAARVRYEVAQNRLAVADAVVLANGALAERFGITDILSGGIPQIAEADAAAAGERHYALFLAGFSQLGADDPSRTTLQVLTALVADFEQSGDFGQSAGQITAGQLVNATSAFINAHTDVITVGVDPAVLANITNIAPAAADDAVSTAEDVALALAAADLLGNDSDIDGDTLSVVSVAALAATKGSVVLADASVSYAPPANFSGEDVFAYVVSDGRGGSTTAAVTVLVQPVNDAPTAGNDSAETPEDSAIAIPVATMLANDVDLDGESLSVLSVSATAETHGTVSLEADAVLFQPDANYNGPAAFTYTVGDPSGATATASVSIEVVAQADAPSIGGVAATSVHIGDTYTFTPVASDADGAGETLTFSAQNLPAWATFDAATGMLSGVPGANDGGTLAQGIVISVKDGTELSAALAPFDIWVVPVLSAPTIEPFGGTYAEPVEVRLATGTQGAEVRYTIDGGDPANGALYTAPFMLQSSATVKAQAFKSGYDASSVTSRSFTIAAGGAPVLTGSLAAAPATVDLALEGTTDWAHWGLNGAAGFNRKADVAQQISNRVVVGIAPANTFADTAVPSFSWGGGTPSASETGYAGGVQVKGVNNGFQITVPADTTDRTLAVYVGVNQAAGRLEATLSDGSAAMSALELSDFAGVTVQKATLSFRAAAAGQYLTVRYTCVDATLCVNGRVGLYGAALANAVAQPIVATPAISLPGGYFSSTAQVTVTSATPAAQIRYTLDGSDPAYGDVYTGPITLTASAQLKVQAFADGHLPSLTNTEAFVQGSCAATRIMPTGDSITRGTGSTATEGDAVGYRRKLYLDLTAGGANVDFVGSLDNGALATTGLPFDTQHEGHGGWTIERIIDNTDAEGNLATWLAANHPDMVLLHIGTNNTAAAGQYTDPAQLSRLLDEIDRYSPQARVVLARIINENPNRTEIKLFNQNVATMAGGRIINGDRLSVVDMEPVLNYATDMDDKLHPNIGGYDKMAAAWLTAVQPLLPACLP